MTNSEMKTAIDAFERDGVIRCRKLSTEPGDWWETKSPGWDFADYEFSPKPSPREWWLNLYENAIHKGYVHESPEAALREKGGGYIETVHVREVMPE